jgi:hypothetical protein
MSFRTDRNNNPTAFTTAVAELGLVLGKDYVVGEEFKDNLHIYHTAKLIGDPIAVTIKLIDKIGFRTGSGLPRWTYIDINPKLIWDIMPYGQKVQILAFMYKNEGGTELTHLFTQNVSVGVSDTLPIKGA